MIYDLMSQKTDYLPNFKGGLDHFEAKTHFDGTNRIMRGKLVPGASIGEHFHKISSEFIYILSGKGHILYDGDREEVEAGMCHYCPKGHIHSIINDGDEDLIFFAVVAIQ